MDERKSPVQHSYPSPTVDGAEPHYYPVVPQRTQPPEEAHSEADYHGLPDVEDGQGVSQHRELQGLQRAIAEPSATQQDLPRPPVNERELQLTAQLTQGITQHMAAQQNPGSGMQYGADVQDLHYGSDQEIKYKDQVQYAEVEGPDLEGERSSAEDHDSGIRQQIQAELQNHEHELQAVIAPRHEQPQPQSQPQSQQLANLASVRSPQPPLPAHLHPHLVQQIGSATYHMSDHTPPRKRSKVSRACDECRRKKIRCEFPLDVAGDTCNHCRRSSVPCLFSRVPQKRGPSKGYIKELADRIISIEGKLGAAASEGLDTPARRDDVETLPSTISNGESSRKRPFSSISSDGFATPVPSKHAGWVTGQRSTQPLQTPIFPSPYSSQNDLAPRPIAPASYPLPNDEGSQAQPVEDLDDLSHDEFAQSEAIREIDDGVFETYLATISRTLPVLAKTKARVQSALSQCPALLHQAFIEAFYAMMRPLHPSAEHAKGDTSVANRFLKLWEAENHPDAAVTNLVRLQTLAMMIIETDNCDPMLSDRRPVTTDLLWRAIGIGLSMKLHEVAPDPTPGPDVDLDSDDNVALRVWWVLVVLDRWNALGNASRLLVPNDIVLVLPGLKHVLGEAGFHLIHLTFLLGHMNPIYIKPSPELVGGPSLVVDSLLNVSIESWRINFPSHLSAYQQPVLHLAYWHVRLLYDLFSSSSKSETVLRDCRKITGFIAKSPELLSPLNHHFISLVSLVLLELMKVGSAREEAGKLISELLEPALAPSAWNVAVCDRLQEKGRPLTGIDSQNLQHLADLATKIEPGEDAPAAAGEGESLVTSTRQAPYVGLGFDPMPLLRKGYLNVFRPTEAN